MFDPHRSTVAPNVKSVLVCLMLSVIATAHNTIDSKWHSPMGKADYHAMYHGIQIASSPSSSPSPSHSLTKSSVSTGHNASTASTAFAFVPSFQGTLLAYCIDSNDCNPLFLSPVSIHYMPRLILQLSDMSSTRPTKWLSIPPSDRVHNQSQCLSRPFSHAAHCNFIPTRFPLPGSFTSIGYDWRLSFSALRSRLSSKLQAFINTNNNASRIVIVAQGTACHLVSAILSNAEISDHDVVFICLHPLRIIEAWNSFIRHISIVDVRQNAPRHETTLSDLDAGLSARRRSRGWPPQIGISGPWLYHSEDNNVLHHEFIQKMVRSWPALDNVSPSDNDIIPINTKENPWHTFCVAFDLQHKQIDSQAEKNKNCEMLFPSAQRVEVTQEDGVEEIVQTVLSRIDSSSNDK